MLEAIDAAGSILAAARILAMSYRRAWLLTDDMNRRFVGKADRHRRGWRYGPRRAVPPPPDDR